MNGTSGALSRGRQLLFSLDRKKELKAEFERAALPHLSHLYTSAFYLTKDKAEAEDLVQETYIRALRFFDKFKPGTNCRAWLLTILRNLRHSFSKRETQSEAILPSSFIVTSEGLSDTLVIRSTVSLLRFSY